MPEHNHETRWKPHSYSIQLKRIFTSTKFAVPVRVPALLPAGYPQRLGGDVPPAHLGEVQLAG